MRAFTVRMVLSGLALSPALFLQLTSPVQFGQLAKLAGGASGVTLAAAAICFASVLAAHLLPGKRGDPKENIPARAPALVRRTDLARLIAEAPPNEKLDILLFQALSPRPRAARPKRIVGPETAERVIARLLRSTMQHMGVNHLSQASRSQKVELYTLLTLLQGSRQTAGELAAMFHNPSAVTSLHNLVVQAATRRARFEEQSQLFEATNALWKIRPAQHQRELQDALQRLGMKDLDLWHHVVTHAAFDDPNQQRAAHWCLSKAQCDQATAAVFLTRVVVSGHLAKLVRSSETRRRPLKQLILAKSVFNRWAEGFYKTNEICWASDAELGRLETRFEAGFRRITQHYQMRELPYPAGLFLPIGVRVARDRSNWNIRRGVMERAPQVKDYFDAAPPI